MFHNGSIYDYHFVIKELAEEFEGEFKCLGENTEKYITFSVPIRKEITKKDKDGNDKITKIHKIKFIDSYRFMSCSSSSLVTNLSKGLHNDRCTDCKSYLDYMATKDEKLIFRCFECKKSYEKDITDVDYTHAKRVFKGVALKSLNNKNLDDYHDLYVQSDTLLLADVFCVLKYMS